MKTSKKHVLVVIALLLAVIISDAVLLETSNADTRGDLCEYGDGEYIFDHATQWLTVHPLTEKDEIDPETGRKAHFFYYYEARSVKYVCNVNSQHYYWVKQKRFVKKVLAWYID